jgi:large subunit ribosomal protein L1
MAGKKLVDAMKKVDREKLYQPEEAIELLKELSYAKFDETVEIHLRTGVDPRHADQVIRASVALPAGTGKTRRVIAFVQGDKAREAEEAGADAAGGEELVQRIQGGWLDFDVAVASPDMMGLVGRLGRVLGPRGLMPNPKAGTVTFDVGRAVREVKAGKIEFRVDKGGNVHAPIGKVSFDADAIESNFAAFMDQIVRSKPAAAKGVYVKIVAISSSMGPGVTVDTTPYR